MTQMTDEELQVLSDGFEDRVAEMLEGERGKAFEAPPVWHDRWGPGSHFSRALSMATTRFAMISFLLNDQVEAANRALQELCAFYMRERVTMYNRDSFYWAHELYTRIYLFFNTTSPSRAARLTAETEKALLEMMWTWCRSESVIADAELMRERETWYFQSSENHVAQKTATAWEFSQILKAHPEYADRRYDDGHTASEHWSAWTQYHKDFCLERARRGLFFEVASPSYCIRTLVGIYNMVDLSEDEELRSLAGKLLDLWWASWSEDQIDGVRGGGKARVRGWKALSGGEQASSFTWYYYGRGTPVDSTSACVTVVTSDYRLPSIVMDLAMDVEGRGVYEVKQRRMGLAVGPHNRPPDSWFRTDYGGILRYLYCTPDFILGTNMREARPQPDWHLGASQSIWHGAIFRGHPNALIVPKCNHETGDTLNEQWSVQRRGTLIVQKLKTHVRAGKMMVWFSSEGISEPIEEDGWVFAETIGAYAAVRPVTGPHSWQDAPGSNYTGRFLVCEDEWSPVIVEIARKVAYENAKAFRNAIKSLSFTTDGDELSYSGLSGDTFCFDGNQNRVPEIDGTPVNYAPQKVFDSPFVSSDWCSGIVTVRKGRREHVLDFNQC
mgnify:CR=1 FL=1